MHHSTILSTFRSSRAEYVEQLLADIVSYYGYNDFLADKLFNLFPAAEVCLQRVQRSYFYHLQAIEFFEANEVPRPVTIRTNTLRTRRRDLAQTLVNRGVNLEPIGKWTNVGLQIFESSVPIGIISWFVDLTAPNHSQVQRRNTWLDTTCCSPHLHSCLSSRCRLSLRSVF